MISKKLIPIITLDDFSIYVYHPTLKMWQFVINQSIIEKGNVMISDFRKKCKFTFLKNLTT